jgi:hypothetical protein
MPTVRPTGNPSSRPGSGNRPKALDEGFSRAGICDIDRGHDDPQHDLRAFREVIDALPLLGRQSIAVIRDNRRIGTIELDLRRVVDDTADHRNGLKNGREHIEANEGRERVDEKAHEPHRLVLRSSSNPGILSSPSTRRPDRTGLGRRAEAGGRPSAAESLRRPCAWNIRR